MKQITTKTVIIICLVGLFAGLALGAAAYLMTSNTITTSPTAKATLTLTQDNATPIAGVDTVKYTATCNDVAFTGLVTFKDGAGNTLGTATAVAGIAILNYSVPATQTAPFTVTATASHP